MEMLAGFPKELVDVALGLVIGGVALLVPFRVVDARPDRFWDLVGLVGGMGFALGVKALCGAATAVAWEAHLLERWCLAVYALPWWMVLPVYFVLADLGGYLTHRLMHTKALWPAHAWHHSSPYVSWLSGLRGSPLHVLLLIAPYYLLSFLLPYEAPMTVSSAVSAMEFPTTTTTTSDAHVPSVDALRLER